MNEYRKGLTDGAAIGAGYLSVSFSFGMMGVSFGLPWWQVVLLSAMNMTSAGQFAGLSVMVCGGTMVEMALSQLVINLRYALMSISLSQKVEDRFRGWTRFVLGFAITDEIYAVAMGHSERVSRSYFAGLATLPYIGWTLGTLLGALLGEVLPEIVTGALGIALYGMFIAIVVPMMRENGRVVLVVLLAVLLSSCFYYIPFLQGVPKGFATIIACVVAAMVGAMLDMREEVCHHE